MSMRGQSSAPLQWSLAETGFGFTPEHLPRSRRSTKPRPAGAATRRRSGAGRRVGSRPPLGRAAHAPGSASGWRGDRQVPQGVRPFVPGASFLERRRDRRRAFLGSGLRGSDSRRRAGGSQGERVRRTAARNYQHGAKAFAALLHASRDLGGWLVLFWHTHTLSEPDVTVDRTSVPPAFRRYFSS